MIRRNCITIISWIVTLIVFLPRMGNFQVQTADESRLFEFKLRNFYNTTLEGLGSFSNVKPFAIPEELDDMTPNFSDTFDFIVVGAGSAGATIAARLSEMKGMKILLIEAGDKENILMDVPLLSPLVTISKDIKWDYETEPSSSYCRGMINNICKIPQGKVMGGSSTINYMIATRGSHQIYNHWARQGCYGWSYRDVLPFFKKLENLNANDSSIEWNYHNIGGPVDVTETPENDRTVAGNAFLKAGVERGFSVIDYNGARQIGYSHVQTNIKDGRKCSSNRAYLHPIKGRPNLYVTKNSHVEKILINHVTKRAYGVTFRKHGRKIRVLAKKEVILCAGAIGSPQLLMLSGIGPANHLKKHCICVLKDAPVGENLMDHFTYWGLNFLVNDSITINAMNLLDPSNPTVRQYVERREGKLVMPVATESLAFIDVDNLSNRQSSPNIELIQTGMPISSNPVNREVYNMAESYFNAAFANIMNKPSYGIIVVLLSPKSRGKVLLRSKYPRDKPRIIPNYVNHPDDMRRMILGIREAIKLSKTTSFQRFNSQLVYNPILGCESFTIDSDDYWDCAIRTFGSTIYHPAGTCKMGAMDDPTAVVNPRLRVIGIGGLRVADASIMPTIVSGHPNIPIIMIGEKLAEMIKEDWNFIQEDYERLNSLY